MTDLSTTNRWFYLASERFATEPATARLAEQFGFLWRPWHTRAGSAIAHVQRLEPGHLIVLAYCTDRGIRVMNGWTVQDTDSRTFQPVGRCEIASHREHSPFVVPLEDRLIQELRRHRYEPDPILRRFCGVHVAPYDFIVPPPTETFQKPPGQNSIWPGSSPSLDPALVSWVKMQLLRERAAGRSPGDYRALRQVYLPDRLRLIVIAESPPASGQYFYDPAGGTGEPLYREITRLFFGRSFDTKAAGLAALRDAGYLLVDATYTPVDRRSDRDVVIREGYRSLVEDLLEIECRSTTPLVLVKKNVCEILEPLLSRDGFRVLNQGRLIYFPSSGQQGKFRRQMADVLRKAGFLIGPSIGEEIPDSVNVKGRVQTAVQDQTMEATQLSEFDRVVRRSMSDILHRLTQQLARFLSDVLPRLEKGWWMERVLTSLTPDQARRVSRGGREDLSDLDFAALRNVIDRNWRDISRLLDLPWESLDYVKAMRGIRNRWAHSAAVDISPKDVALDLENLDRFGRVIKANPSLMADIESLQESVYAIRFGDKRGMGEPRTRRPTRSRLSDLNSTDAGPDQSSHRSLDRMPAIKRKVFDAGSRAEGGSLAGMAAELGCTVSNIRQHLYQISSQYGYLYDVKGDRFWILERE